MNAGDTHVRSSVAFSEQRITAGGKIRLFNVNGVSTHSHHFQGAADLFLDGVQPRRLDSVAQETNALRDLVRNLNISY